MFSRLNDSTPKTEKIQQNSPFRSLGISLFLCCLGIGAALLFERMNGNNKNGFVPPRPDYRDIPSELITYQQISVAACPVDGEPTCFAVLGTSTFIIGTAEPPALSFFNENGTLLRKLNLPEEPKALACEGTTKIVVAHAEHIAVYTAEGNRSALWQLPDEKSDIQSIVLTPEYLFAADTGKRCIYRFDAEGNVDLTFGEDFVVYASPMTMTFSPKNGLLYIANPGRHRVDVFTQEGVCLPELRWGEPSGNVSGFAGCCNPIGLAVLDNGRILTVEKSVSRIKIFAEGKLDGVVAGYGILDRPPTMAHQQPAEPGGRYFAAVPLSETRIAVFDFDRQIIRIFTPLILRRTAGSL